MSSSPPVLISDTNLSVAWSRVLLHVIEGRGTTEIEPLVLSIGDLDGAEPPEVTAVRTALDGALRANNEFAVNTVANTIFPRSVWRRSRGDRHAFFRIYVENLPRYAAIEGLNRKGTYFSRLVAFDTDARTGERVLHRAAALPMDGNQLENVINTLTEDRIRRDSALQASIFDAARDHSAAAYQSFPCMQHVTFLRTTDRRSLVLNAFYATQQIVRKAYGNFLGLCRLGQFVATESGLTFDRLNVYVGSEKLGGLGRQSLTRGTAALAPLLAAARAAVIAGNGAPPAPAPAAVHDGSVA